MFLSSKNHPLWGTKARPASVSGVSGACTYTCTRRFLGWQSQGLVLEQIFEKKNGCFPEYVAGWWWVCLWKWFPLSTWCLAVPDISADVSRWMPSSGRTLTIAEACAAAASGTVGETVQEHGDWCFLVDETIFVDICWNVMIFLICFGICWKKPKWKWRNVPTVWLFLPGNIKCHLNLFIEFPTEIPWNTIMSRISLGGCGHCFNE